LPELETEPGSLNIYSFEISAGLAQPRWPRLDVLKMN
jgi:hypothetical protein